MRSLLHSKLEDFWDRHADNILEEFELVTFRDVNARELVSSRRDPFLDLDLPALAMKNLTSLTLVGLCLDRLFDGKTMQGFLYARRKT